MKGQNLLIETHFLALPYADEKRRIRVLLPTEYHDQPHANYPVLYMHDGQNLFFDHESYSGKSWGVIDSLTNPDFPPMIVVGIDHAEAFRVPEYAPWPVKNVLHLNLPSYKGDGKAYAQWFINLLKPFIDEHYRTKADVKNTFLAGSSMGGLITAYMASAYPNVFGGIGIFSMASWINEEAFLEFCSHHPLPQDISVFIQVGTNEGDPVGERGGSEKNQLYITNSLNYYNLLIKQGLPIDQIDFHIIANAHHTESVWASYFPNFLKHLFN